MELAWDVDCSGPGLGDWIPLGGRATVHRSMMMMTGGCGGCWNGGGGGVGKGDYRPLGYGVSLLIWDGCVVFSCFNEYRYSTSQVQSMGWVSIMCGILFVLFVCVWKREGEEAQAGHVFSMNEYMTDGSIQKLK